MGTLIIGPDECRNAALPYGIEAGRSTDDFGVLWYGMCTSPYCLTDKISIITNDE